MSDITEGIIGYFVVFLPFYGLAFAILFCSNDEKKAQN